MFELLMQDSYTEWIIPLTLAVIWILSWQLFSTAQYVGSRGKIACHCHIDPYTFSVSVNEQPIHRGLQLVKTVKRKEHPDDGEGPHSSI